MAQHLRLGAGIVLFILFTGFFSSAKAAETIPEVHLRDGRTLHGVVVIKENPTSINVRADEGLLQLPKALLPEDLRTRYPLRADDVAAEQAQHEKDVRNFEQGKEARQEKLLADEKARQAEREKRAVRNGIRIISFTTFRGGILDVELKNENDFPTQIDPSLLLGRSADNIVYSGRWVVRTSTGIKATDRNARFAGNATNKLLISFTRKKDATIQDVYWTQEGLTEPAPAASK